MGLITYGPMDRTNAAGTTPAAGHCVEYTRNVGIGAICCRDASGADWDSCASTAGGHISIIGGFSNSVSVQTLCSQVIAASSAGNGSVYRMVFHIHTIRGATVTACTLTVNIRINAATIITFGFPINTAASSSGELRGEFELSVLGAAGAAASYTLTGVMSSSVAGGTSIVLPTTSGALTVASNAAITFDANASMAPAIATVGFNNLTGHIYRVAP